MNRFVPSGVRGIPAILALFLFTAGAEPVLAQVDARIILGLGASTLSESGGESRAFDPIVRLMAGAGVTFPFRGGWSFRPEIRYLTRGAAFEGAAETLPVDMILELTSLDLGLMAGFEVPLDGDVTPRVFAGPVIAWITESSLSYRSTSGGSWYSDSYDGVRRIDASVGGGLEVAFPAAGTKMLVGARAVLGVSELLKQGAGVPEWRQRGLDVYVGLGL